MVGENFKHFHGALLRHMLVHVSADDSAHMNADAADLDSVTMWGFGEEHLRVLGIIVCSDLGQR